MSGVTSGVTVGAVAFASKAALGSSVAKGAGSLLPFTGVAVEAYALLAFGLIAVGLVMRHLGRTRS
jgi:hypothetical protein